MDDLHPHHHPPLDDDEDDSRGGHHHHHHHAPSEPPSARSRARFALRAALACAVLLGAVAATTAVTVAAGQADLVTRFGSPVRVLTKPGLAWKLPSPAETVIPVDLRLRTTSSGLQDVGTRDGLRILVQAFVAWQVPDQDGDVRLFVRSVRNDSDDAARQLRSFLGSALQMTASSFDLSDLVNTDPAHVQIRRFEQVLQESIEGPMRSVYGMAVRSVGIERLSLPDSTLAATVSRMRSERETVAAERTAEGLRLAAEIRSGAVRDSRIEVARANTDAAAIEAAARREAADIQGRAYARDPQLYLTLRGLDTLGNIVGPNTRLVLRTDSAPFDLLTSRPGACDAAEASSR